ncbi:MAG: class I tRNA ligase family protein, partial [Clostridia bacterium]|nr:class I tRNA ligase family protein [Clostridia bacterium]
QTTIYQILDALTRLIAPILAFTSDEIWSYMPHLDSHDTRNIIFNEIPEIAADADAEFMARWKNIQSIRDDVKKALEIARNEKVIGASLEAAVTIYTADESVAALINENNEMFKGILIVSNVAVENCEGGSFAGEIVGVSVKHAEGEKCDRCWIYSETVGNNKEGAHVCERCAKVLGL